MSESTSEKRPENKRIDAIAGRLTEEFVTDTGDAPEPGLVSGFAPADVKRQ